MKTNNKLLGVTVKSGGMMRYHLGRSNSRESLFGQSSLWLKVLSVQRSQQLMCGQSS